MSAKYERLPSDNISRSPSPEQPEAGSSHSGSGNDSGRPRMDEEKRRLYMAELREQEVALASDPRFEREAPSAWKRVALLVFIVLMFWVAIRMRMDGEQQKPVNAEPEVIYASRYSKDHKYRPAASPILTKTLANGKIRIHGADPTHVHMQGGPRHH